MNKKLESEDFANIMDFRSFRSKSGPESLLRPSLRPGIVCFPYCPEANFRFSIKSGRAQNKIINSIDLQKGYFLFLLFEQKEINEQKLESVDFANIMDFGQFSTKIRPRILAQT